MRQIDVKATDDPWNDQTVEVVLHLNNRQSSTLRYTPDEARHLAAALTAFLERQECCPASGRTAKWCTDQTHVACYAAHRESVALDRKIEIGMAR